MARIPTPAELERRRRYAIRFLIATGGRTNDDDDEPSTPPTPVSPLNLDRDDITLDRGDITLDDTEA